MTLRARLTRLGGLALPWVVGLLLAAVALDELEHTTPARVNAAVALAAVQGAALHWRRTRPVPSAAVVLSASLGFHMLAPMVIVPFAGLISVASLAAVRPPRTSLIGLVALQGVSVVNALTAPPGDTAFTIGLGVGAWALGEAARTRRIAIAEATRRAVGEEQARIARELHDVIAHSVSVIVVQAAAAGDVFDRRPDQARAALGAIERSGRDALAELRRLLGAVRPAAGDTDGAPAPGLARLDDLAEPLRTGGLVVAVHREGTETPLPAGVDLTAYRIVQEALTNTLRHADATRADVTVTYRPGAVEVDVRDDGRATPADTGRGHGLVGMRERAALLHGSIEAGPEAGGGYRVHARLPLGTPP